MQKHKHLVLWGAASLLVAIVIIGFAICTSATFPRMMRYPGDERFNQKRDVFMNSSMYESMGGMMLGLAGKTGAEFDQAFLREMIVHHQGAVAMAKEVLIKSERPELKKMAEDIIKAQTAEIEQMKKWQTAWVE